MFGAVLGIAQAGMGIMSAFGGHSAQVAQVDAENKYRREVYKQQLDEWKRKNLEANARYKTKVNMYEEQVENNSIGASRARFTQQRRLNQQYSQNKLQQQAAGIQQAQAIGAVNARQVSGKSQDRLRGSTLAAFGRNQAIRQQNLMNVRQETAMGMEEVNRQQNLANRKAHAEVMFAPTFSRAPVAPMVAQGPSSMSLYAGIGSSLMSGFGTASELTAPGQGINKILGI
jgi:hypothetical protein